MRGLAFFVSVLMLAGCGGGTKPACRSPKQAQALVRLNADLAAIRTAAALPVTDALKGGPEINRATDRFLHDVQTAPVGNLQRNRFIDHAAALLLGSCSQCFQALEAARPIPGIAHGDLGCPAAYSPAPYSGARQRKARAVPVSRNAPAA
ncbi:MAG: hypothetical protein QOK22_1481 [Gaiellaceae bacterium]|nr:hypothetical protein [Gaiellaceae bacterium]